MAETLVVLFAAFFGMIFLGVPVAAALGLSSFFAAAVSGIPIMGLVHNVVTGLDSFTILAVPLFILVASLMNNNDITKILIDFAKSIFGRVHGSLAYVNILVSMIFAGMSGSHVADTAGVGKVMIAGMREQGYKPDFSVAVTAISSTIGTIIPPSIVMVIYGAFTETSIAALFLAGAIPGLLIGFSQMGYVAWTNRREGLPGGTKYTLRQKAGATALAAPCFPVPIILIGGIVLGWFTATEAATVAVLYILFINVFIYRNFSLQRTWAALKESVLLIGPVLFAVANSIPFGWILAYHRFPQMVGEWASTLGLTAFTVVIFVHFLFLLLGTFLGAVETIVIFGPILMALAEATGADPVLMGVVACMTLSIGAVTPPYGLCLMIACRLGEIRVGQGFRRILPLLVLEILIVNMAIFFPDMVLFLPRLMLSTGG